MIWKTIIGLGAFLIAIAQSPLTAESTETQNLVVPSTKEFPDQLPEGIIEAVENKDRALTSIAPESAARYFTAESKRWQPGQVLKVAFADTPPIADSKIHEIVSATRTISDACNIQFDFINPKTGRYRRWSISDQTYAAEIRVSCNSGGDWSLVGTDSITSAITTPLKTGGGHWTEPSMNLSNFRERLPVDWKRIVRHEFMHAVGMEHEHQRYDSPCGALFRWEDDPGYEATLTIHKEYISDSQQRRPGLYTWFSGHPNNWGRPKVDFQMKPRTGVFLKGNFDHRSLLLYRFPTDFYITVPNACMPQGNEEDLSEGDRLGLLSLYPREHDPAMEVADRRASIAQTIADSPDLPEVLRESLSRSIDEANDKLDKQFQVFRSELQVKRDKVKDEFEKQRATLETDFQKKKEAVEKEIADLTKKKEDLDKEVDKLTDNLKDLEARIKKLRDKLRL